jgi:hypothetical protein
MEQLLFYQSTIVTLSLVLCAALATIGTIMIVRKIVFMSGTTFRQFLELRFRPAALRHTERFEELLSEYQEIADILGQYTPDYSIVFNEANWTKLNLQLDDLNAAYVELCDLLCKGDSKDAMCLAEFLSSSGEPLAEWKYRHISDEWEGLADWEHELHDIVCKVIQTLWDAVVQARKLGIARGASAEEVLAVIERIRDRL